MQSEYSNNKTYHMITGLPRAGSTLLTSILKQNPRFHASSVDPLATLVSSTMSSYQTKFKLSTADSVNRCKNSIKGLVDGYYADVSNPVIFNTNTAWTFLLPLVSQLYPQSKMILCVRDIQWILDSFESAYRRNPFNKNIVSDDNVYSRTTALMKDDGIVGNSYIGIKQAITSQEKNKIMIVEHDLLYQNPRGVLQGIYNFIGEDYFEHDFNNLKACWDEYDPEFGADLHHIKQKIEHKPRETILPPDLIQQYSKMEVWRL